jgi:hypothetical protein
VSSVFVRFVRPLHQENYSRQRLTIKISLILMQNTQEERRLLERRTTSRNTWSHARTYTGELEAQGLTAREHLLAHGTRQQRPQARLTTQEHPNSLGHTGETTQRRLTTQEHPILAQNIQENYSGAGLTTSRTPILMERHRRTTQAQG